MKVLFLLPFLFSIYVAEGQDLQYYRYESDFLTKEFHKERRESLRKLMPDSSAVILFSAPERHRSNDFDYPYHQDANFYYLAGLTEPDALLLILKNVIHIGSYDSNEFLFLRSRKPEEELWTGRRLGVNGAKQFLGFEASYTNEAFDTLNIPFTGFKKVFYLPLPKGIVDDVKNPSDLFNLVEQFKKKSNYPSDNGDNSQLGSWLAELRQIKQPEEIALIRKAVDISCDGHVEMMKALEPGMTEYQVQAVGEYIFKKRGAEEVGYPSICGGGENSCILHYESNRRTLFSHDLLLLDMGAEFHGYSADVTRTLPVNGKFSNEQKAIYQIVFAAQEAALKECKAGNAFQEPNKAAKTVIKQGLIDLGIIKEGADLRKYFMHGTSHYLGLEVHDMGTYGSLQKGNIITVEPGIYIPEGSPCNPKWWNIGIRIEDDVLILESGYENLSNHAPRTIETIEEEMKQKSKFNGRN
jgi:Xaa-Pro aminopeptidase